MPPRSPVVVSWSSGKDAAWALERVRHDGGYDVVGLLTTVTEAYGRVSMHGVRESLLRRQAEALGLPLHVAPIPAFCSNAVYEATMRRALGDLGAAQVRHVVFGDLFLEDVRAYREALLAGTGFLPLFPLWGEDTASLARAMLAGGLDAYVTVVDPRRVSPELAGAHYNAAFLDRLPADVDPCGERGEFHTVVVAGPMFDTPIAVTPGEVVARDGFVFADVIPDGDVP